MTEKIHALYIDDEPDLRIIGKVFLERLGDFSVTTAPGAVEAIDLLKEKQIDVIISDYQMPQMDGIAFLKHLKAKGDTTPFILFTGKGREEVVIEALNNGANFYLQKGGEPQYQFTELSHKIQSAVSQRRTEKLAKNTEKRLFDIINFLPDATFAIDTEGKVIAWNRAIEEMTGVPARDMLGKGNHEYSIPFYGERRPILIDLVSIPDEGFSQGKYTVIKKEGDILIADTALPRPLGRYSVLLGKASLLYNHEGKVVGAIESIRDITEQKRGEERLREREHQLDAMATNIPGVVYRFVVNPDGTYGFDYISVRSRQILGIENDPASFFNQLTNGIIPENREQFRSSVQNAIISKTLWEFEGQYVKPSGGKIWISAMSNPLMENDHIIFDGVIFEITERKLVDTELLRKNEELHAAYEEISATEEELRANLDELIRQDLELRESKRELADIIDFLPDATFVINLDGTVVAWNHAIEEMTGIAAEQMIGKGNYEYALPFYLERRPIMVDLILHDDPVVTQKYPGITRKGSYLYSEIFIPHFNNDRGAYFWFTACPLYDTAGNLKGAIESIRDITERKGVEEALAESERKYRNVVEDQTELICRFLPDGTHIFVNDAYCRYFDMKQEDIIWHRFKPVLHPEDRGIVSLHMASLTPEHPVANVDQRIIMPDGTMRWQRWSDRAIFDNNGILKEYQSVGRDITDYKQTEHALALANKNLSLLSSITRHDINNQLTALMGYLEILEDTQINPLQNSYLLKVSIAAQRISTMIWFTKEYEDIGIYAPTWQDCRKLVEMAAKQAPLGPVTLENDLPVGAEVFADPLIVKVYYNLIDNAVRHGGKITTIRFSGLNQEGNYVVVCEDDGDGVPTLEKEQIFERGFGKNTGFGLFLVREILSITGLCIRECGDPGKGARFEITIPSGKYHFNREDIS